MSQTTSPLITTASLSHPQTLQLLSLLEALLPYTIPLTRRIQCHLRAPKDASEIILSISLPPTGDAATSSPEDIDVLGCIDKWLSKGDEAVKDVSLPWIASFVDLTFPGTTQGWVFGSWELPSPSSSSSDASPAPPLTSNLQKELLYSLLTHISTQLVPRQPISPPPSWLWLRDNKKWVSQPYSRSKVLFGTVHEGVRNLIDDKAVARVDARYEKWIFGQGLFNGIDGEREEGGGGLKEGYEFGTLDESELQTTLDRSPIPRTLSYLKEVTNAGVYYDPDRTDRGAGTVKDIGEGKAKGELVAYAFLGKDGSLGGLDVAPAHKGKRIAGALTKELFRRQADTFSLKAQGDSDKTASEPSMAGKDDEQRLGREDKEGWFYHADVGEDNNASRRVMEKLGGKVMWRVCWVEVDLDVVLGGKERAIEIGDERRLDEEEEDWINGKRR